MKTFMNLRDVAEIREETQQCLDKCTKNESPTKGHILVTGSASPEVGNKTLLKIDIENYPFFILNMFYKTYTLS
jgi:hypothetical protein